MEKLNVLFLKLIACGSLSFYENAETLSVSLLCVGFLPTLNFSENTSALDPEGLTPYPEGSGKQPPLDDLLPSIPSLPSLDLPHDISSKTTLGTDADNQESKVLVNSMESSLPTAPETPEHEAASEQKGEAAAQDPE